jgi:tubulin polyglutamylase TTLL9
MTANTPQDYDGKIGLLEDTYTCIDLEAILKGDEEQVGGFDLIVKGNTLKPDPKA